MLKSKKPPMKYRSTIFIVSTCLIFQIIQTIYPDFIMYEALNSSFFGHILTLPLALIGLIVYQFGHAGWAHFLGNFSFTLPFCLYLEHRMGSDKFLKYYLLCGIASAIVFMLMPMSSAYLIGASGSLFGVMTGACLSFGETKAERALAIALLCALVIPQFMWASMSAMLLVPVAFWGHIGGTFCGAIALPHFLKKD